MILRWFRRPAPPAELLAVDFETSGLDPRRDAILALGLVPLSAGTIRWGERFYSLVADDRLTRPRDPEALGSHQILPAETRRGIPLGELIERLEAAGRPLLAHGAAIERRFLAAAARHLGRRSWRPPVVDTLAFLLAIHDHRQHLTDRLPGRPPGDAIPTRLDEARAYFGLPAYPPHHALYDALAAAELYLLLGKKYPELAPPATS